MKSQMFLLLRLTLRLSLGLLALLGLCLMLGMPARPAHAQSTLTVTNCGNDIQLQADISQANSDNDGDAITFTCSGDIQLTATLNITGNMIIDGTGESVILDGQQQYGVFQVNSGANLTLNALTISNGIGVSNNSYSSPVGGGIANFGTLTLTNSTLSNNSATLGGGAIYNSATAILANSTLNNNSAGTFGGSIFNDGGTMLVSNSTLSGNSTPEGSGGGIFNYATLNISDSIVAENSASSGNDCSSSGGTITDNGYNLESGTDCGFTGTGSLQNTNPQLAALANNGGPTQTMALQPGSPAIDAIPLSANICPSTDQRGDPRPDADTPAEAMCDIGAYESNYPSQDNNLGLTNMPTNISTKATSASGAVVTYTSPTATDESGDTSSATVTCTPASGTTFAIGVTTVTCTATDSDDTNSPVNQSFTVTVKPVLTLKMPATMKTSEGATFNLVNVTGTAYGTVNPLTATITWGDGSNAEVISVMPAADGSYSVSTSHSYAEEGSYSLTITVGDHSKLAVARTATVKVTDAALKITKSSGTLSSLTATWTGTFTDADPNGTLSDYSASITWGDGNTTPATVSANSSGSGFTAQGSHTYASHGAYTAILTITDSGGSTVSKTITITV